MQLASLLPGIRDLRAPLAGGMLWLVFGWFLLHALADDAYALAAEWPWSSFTPLFSDIGAGGIIVAASFAAYVIGATVVDPVNSWIRRTSVMVVLHIDTFMGVRSLYLALFRSHRSKVRSLQGQIHGVSTAFIWAQVRTLSFASADVWEFIRRCADALDVREKDLHNDLGLDCDLLGDALHYAAVPEYEQLGDRLLVEQSTLFAAVDRLRAESEFRFAVAVPLFAIAVMLSIALSPWWLLVAAATLVLLRNAVTLTLSYVERLFNAWAAGVVIPPAAEPVQALTKVVLTTTNAQHEPVSVTRFR